MDHNGYFVMVADPYSRRPTFFPDNSPSGGRVQLPDAVQIRDVTGGRHRHAFARHPRHPVYPEGYVDGTLVHLIDKKGRVMTLRIDPLTGQVSIARGDFRLSGSALAMSTAGPDYNPQVEIVPSLACERGWPARCMRWLHACSVTDG